MAKRTHKSLVLEALEAGEIVTAPRMFMLHNITRLSSHIYDLRNAGCLIKARPSQYYSGFQEFYLDNKHKVATQVAHNLIDALLVDTVTSDLLFDNAEKLAEVGL